MITKLFKKYTRIICMLLGGAYALFGLFALAIVTMQSLMLSGSMSDIDESFTNSLSAMHSIFKIYMPLLILLGIGYLIFGIFYNRIKSKRYQINLLLSIMCIAWIAGYIVNNVLNVDELNAGFANNNEALKLMAYGYLIFGSIIALAIMAVPQYILGRAIKQNNIEHQCPPI
ncbi:MAG: hypothetical protein N4A72_03960 [Bacteroidales bacterium]|jgi:hypothetical protein|nr:hypothetical protein [Bacteroidales bacterium]